MPDPANEIRAVIEQGDFARAAALWEQWTAGTLSLEEWARAQELYRWVRPVLLAEKEHLAYQQNKLGAVSAYLSQNRF